MSTNDDALNGQLLALLECPICLDTLSGNIFSCVNGHVACKSCSGQLNKCGVCRAAGPPSVRCFRLEQVAALVKKPCENAGCQSVLFLDEAAEHKLRCAFGCVCIVCHVWTGTLDRLIEHVKNDHPSNFADITVTDSLKFMMDFFYEGRKFVVLVSSRGSIFWIYMQRNPARGDVLISFKLIRLEMIVASGYMLYLEFASKQGVSSVVLGIEPDSKANRVDGSPISA